MNALTSADISNATDHGVLDSPWTYEVTGITFSANPTGALNGTLELFLSKDSAKITLRFSHAHELEIDAGFPHSYMGLEILDVGFLGWEHSQVRVQGFEEDAPGIRFWAQSVSRVDA
jgi:hypothetical protein